MAWRKGICPPVVGSTRLRHSLVITRTQLLSLLLSVQATDTSVEAACASAVDDDKPERCLASEGVRQPATDPEKTPPSGAVATEQPDLRVAEVVAKETGKVVDKRSDSDVPKYETAKHQGMVAHRLAQVDPTILEPQRFNVPPVSVCVS